MRKAWLVLLGALLAFSALNCSSPAPEAKDPTPPALKNQEPEDPPLPERVRTFSQNGASWKLKVAAREDLRARGLMFVESLADNEGMIFLFSEPDQLSFYMFNCKIPLDIIFLDGTGQVINIHHKVPPCESTDPEQCVNYISQGPAQVVVELAGGQAAKNFISEGQTFLFKPPLKELLEHPAVE